MARGPRVAALGDSLTFGVGDSSTADAGGGWAAHVAASLGAPTFINLAVNGTRARDLASSQVPAAVALDPDLVLLSVGGNDVLRGDFDPIEVERCLSAALAELNRPGRRVLVLGIDRIGLFEALPRAVTSVMARRAAAANGAIIAATASAGATLIDGGAVFRAAGPRAWHIDRVHPSPLGHRRLAGAATALLEGDWPAVAPVPSAPPSPDLWSRAWWLARNGVPWVALRSRDLIPHVAKVVAHELRADQRGRLAPAR
ncbi:SGNH/GDSL hydrolase family protein [Demequina sp.]|uniref:SGNH/GDSL hydrolase family protein n=1 Tax=Demequina sp. TaxID=2050685 RepID=UPI003A86C939